MTEKQIEKFLIELTNLTRKYGIVIEGCGCCGSPFLYEYFGEGEYKVSKDGEGLVYG